MEAKICGVKDKFTLNYIVSHPNAPQYVGFICNYKKSKRFIPEDILRDLIKIKKKNLNMLLF